MLINPMVKSPSFFNRVDFIPGKPWASHNPLPVIRGEFSPYLESMRKLREVLAYGTANGIKK